MTKPKPPQNSLPLIGWREWIALPDLGVDAVKAKVDTGARTSSLHGFHVEEFQRGDQTWVRFEIHPYQRDSKTTIYTEAPLLEHRRVTSSTGHATMRPVVLTTARLSGIQWQIELTLTRRDAMGFRMLLGREAVRGRFVIDPGQSFLADTPVRDGKKPKQPRKEDAS